MKKDLLDIGIPVQSPTLKCNDIHCAFHGFIKVRGRIFVGTVVRSVLHKTATIEFQRQYYLQKYERFEKRRTRLKAHVPTCIEIKKGDRIKIMETRPISKTKNFVAVEILKK